MSLEPERPASRAGRIWASRRKAALALVITCALAAILRLLPINYGSPEPGYFSSDEIDAVSRALKMASGDLMPLHFNKPTLYNEALAAAYGAHFGALKLLKGISRLDFERMFFLEPFPFYRTARLVSIAAAAATLLLLAGSLRHQGVQAQIAALLVLGFARSSVYYAHVAKEDSLAAFFTFAAFVYAARALCPESFSPRRFPRRLAISSLAAGLAVSTKYNCAFAMLFPLAAIWETRTNWRHFATRFAAALGLAALGFWLGTPYALLCPVSFVSGLLRSPIASQIAGGYNILLYANNRGPAFLGQIFWREFGLIVLPLGLAAWTFARASGTRLRLLAILPCGLYVAVLALSSQLDYQYVIVLTPIAAWILGHAISASGAARARSAILWLTVLAQPFQMTPIAKQTIEFMGEDTRLAAGQWVKHWLQENNPERKPLLIASSFYYHYYPALNFDSQTYRDLLNQARQSGAEGGYFRRAAEFAAHDLRPKAGATFLDIRTGFQRTADGKRLFEKQPFPLDACAYAGKQSLVIIPENTLRVLSADAPELEPLKRFLAELAALPKLAIFAPEPWRNSGPRIHICSAPGEPHSRGSD